MLIKNTCHLNFRSAENYLIAKHSQSGLWITMALVDCTGTIMWALVKETTPCKVDNPDFLRSL